MALFSKLQHTLLYKPRGELFLTGSLLSVIECKNTELRREDCKTGLKAHITIKS